MEHGVAWVMCLAVFKLFTYCEEKVAKNHNKNTSYVSCINNFSKIQVICNITVIVKSQKNKQPSLAIVLCIYSYLFIFLTLIKIQK